MHRRVPTTGPPAHLHRYGWGGHDPLSLLRDAFPLRSSIETARCRTAGQFLCYATGRRRRRRQGLWRSPMPRWNHFERAARSGSDQPILASIPKRTAPGWGEPGARLSEAFGEIWRRRGNGAVLPGEIDAHAAVGLQSAHGQPVADPHLGPLVGEEPGLQHQDGLAGR